MRKNKGFTLIELLVVIAIIGLLSGIVLVSMSGARDKAKNSRIQADLTQVRSLAELIYDSVSPNAYNSSVAAPTTDLCTAANALNTGNTAYGPQLTIINSDVDSQNGTANAAPVCFADTASYCVSAVNASGDTVCISTAGQVGNDTCAAANTTCAP